MHLYRAGQTDVLMLAQMNWQLIRDEGSDNAMTVDQLAERMAGFLATTYVAWVMCVDNHNIGYLLVDMGRNPVYLRQMFVATPYRRHGYGRAAFAALCDALDHVPLDVEVFAWNAPAVAFWHAVGFAPRVIQMRRS